MRSTQSQGHQDCSDAGGLRCPRWAVVTGAAGAVGSALCRLLRGRSVRIAPFDTVFREETDDLLRGAVDIVDREVMEGALRSLMDLHGPPGFVAHLASIYPLKSVVALTEEEVDMVLATNLVSAINLCRLVVPAMEKRGGGRVLLMTSQAGVTGGTDAAYASSKAALVALGKSLAREYGRAGVRVNMVSPGPVDTQMAAVMQPERRRHYESAIPIGRFTAPDEVAQLAAFVLLDAPDALNGATIDIDGGLVRR